MCDLNGPFRLCSCGSEIALKVTIIENDKFKRRINAIESLMGKEKPEAIKSGSFKNPISVSLTTISNNYDIWKKI